MIKQHIFNAMSLLVGVFALTSCFSDDSTLGTKEVGDITVSGLEESYTCTAYVGEHLKITPTVDAGYDESDMQYQWILLDGKTGDTDDNGNTIEPTVIGTEKNLDYEVAIAPGTYQIRFIAEAKSNSYKSYSAMTLTVQTNFTEGFYILKETADGNTDLDMLAYNDDLAEDIIAQVDGVSLQGEPLSLSVMYNSWYINPDNDEMEGINTVNVVTKDGQFCVKRATDMKTIFDRSSLLYEGTMSSSEKPYTFLSYMGGMSGGQAYLSSEGVRTSSMSGGYYSSASSGQFGLAATEAGGSQFITHDIPSYGGLVYWDETSHSIFVTDYNLYRSSLIYDDYTGEELTQNLSGFDCLHIGYNYVNYDGAATIILHDNATSKRYLYTTTSSFFGIYLGSYKPIDSSLHMAKATAFCTNGISAKYIYCVDDGKLYACLFDEDELTERQLSPQGIGSGETITYVGNQFWNSVFVGTPFDYLIVGTQKGNEYTIYMYETVGGAPDGDPIKTIHGTGTVKSVRYLCSSFSSSDWLFSYIPYNVND